MRMRALMAVCLAVLAVGCSFPDEISEDATSDAAVSDIEGDPDVPGSDVAGMPDDRNFSSPEGITVWNNRVFVASANFAYQGSSLEFGAGFVTVIDRLNGQVLNRIALPFLNPQEVAVHEGRLWVLCSGSTAWNALDSIVVSKTSGGLAGLAAADSDDADKPSVLVPIPSDEGSLIGYPSGWYLHDGTAWVASGTTAALFQVDLASGTLLRGTDDPLLLADGISQNTTVVGPGPDGLMTIGLFNDDMVMLFDPVAGRVVDEPWAGAPVGQEGLMDGILDIEFDGTDVFVLMGLANQVVSFDAAAGPAAGSARLAGNLLTPNRMKYHGGSLYVVNSGSNSLSVIDVATGDRKNMALPLNCNPWDLDVADGDNGAEVWVTCLKSNRVVRIAAVDGTVLEVE